MCRLRVLAVALAPRCQHVAPPMHVLHQPPLADGISLSTQSPVTRKSQASHSIHKPFTPAQIGAAAVNCDPRHSFACSACLPRARSSLSRWRLRKLDSPPVHDCDSFAWHFPPRSRDAVKSAGGPRSIGPAEGTSLQLPLPPGIRRRHGLFCSASLAHRRRCPRKNMPDFTNACDTLARA